LLNKNIPF